MGLVDSVWLCIVVMLLLCRVSGLVFRFFSMLVCCRLLVKVRVVVSGLVLGVF